MNLFKSLSEDRKNLFFEVLDELSANFNGLSSEDRNYLEMRIENNQFLNIANKEALKKAPLILRLLKEVCIWEPKTNDEKELEEKKEELSKELIEAEERKNNNRVV